MNEIDNLFSQTIATCSPETEKALVNLLCKMLTPPANFHSFDMLHEQPELLFQILEKEGLKLFMPQNAPESQYGETLAGLVDTIAMFWKAQKNADIFSAGNVYFRELLKEPDFCFENEFETYILEFKQLEFAVVLYLLLSIMLVRKRGNRAPEELLAKLEESSGGKAVSSFMGRLFSELDSKWEDPVSQVEGENNGISGGVVSGDVKLLKKIEDLKAKLEEKDVENEKLKTEKLELEETLEAEKERGERLAREKKDVERAREDLLGRLETMKQEWVKEALQDKEFVFILYSQKLFSHFFFLSLFAKYKSLE